MALFVTFFFILTISRLHTFFSVLLSSFFQTFSENICLPISLSNTLGIFYHCKTFRNTFCMKGTVLRKGQLTLCCLHTEHEGGRAIKSNLITLELQCFLLQWPLHEVLTQPPALVSEAWSCWHLLLCFAQSHWAAHRKWTTHKEWQDISDVAQAKKLTETAVTSKKHKSLSALFPFLPCSLSSAEQIITSSSSAFTSPWEVLYPGKEWKIRAQLQKNNSHLLPKYLYFSYLNKLGWYDLA